MELRENIPDKIKPSHDPGWNDPPLFSYDASKAGGQQKRGHVLNKRVAFPLGPKSESTSKVPTSNPPHPLTMPPLPPVSALPPSSSLLSSNTEEATSNYGLEFIPPPVLSKQEGIERVMANLNSVLESAPEDIKKNKEEICRRLDVMKKMWDEDILKPEIHQRLIALSDALKGGDGVLADQIHIGLMVDHVSLCSPWMAGVRYLIHHVKNQTQAYETVEEES